MQRINQYTECSVTSRRGQVWMIENHVSAANWRNASVTSFTSLTDSTLPGLTSRRTPVRRRAARRPTLSSFRRRFRKKIPAETETTTSISESRETRQPCSSKIRLVWSKNILNTRVFSGSVRFELGLSLTSNHSLSRRFRCKTVHAFFSPRLLSYNDLNVLW